MGNQAVAVVKYLSISLFLISSYLMGFHGGVGRSPELFVGAYIVAFGLMIFLWKFNKVKLSFPPIFIIALISRSFLLSYPAGDDIHRYIWEGEIQNEEFNPFELPPDDEKLVHLRNENWKGINHKDIPTIYWPAAQILFKMIAYVSPSVIAFKLAMVFFDLGVLILLFFLIKAINGEPRNIILYALNPFVLHWIAGEGHLESVMVFFMMLALLLFKKEKWGGMYLALSFSILTKITPFIIVPFLLKKKNLKYFPLLFIPMLMFIPYLNDKVSPFSVPGLFAEDFTYNGLLNNILRIFFSKPVTLYISLAFAGIIYLTVLLINTNYLRSTFITLALFIICSPTFHPWYLLILTPLIVFYNSPPWIILHLTVVVKSFFWIKGVDCEFWHNDTILLYIEYVPFLLMAILSHIYSFSKFPYKYNKVKTISVIIPTLNEEQNIISCLNAIKDQQYIEEIIISDCGSTDKTIDLAKKYNNVKIVESPRGRGIQIAKALSEVKGDVVVIVHADSVLKPNSLGRMINMLNENRDASGGAFGAFYSDHRFPLFIPRILNVFRASILGISFGDQAQFFRRDAIGEFPEFKLMEDIELSMRMKEQGKTLFISKGVVSSSRMWKRKGYIQNFVKVIYLSSQFLLKRKLGLLSKDCGEFYRAYYGK